MNPKQILGFMAFLTLLVCSSHAADQWVPRPIPAGVSIGSVRPDKQDVLRGGTLGCMIEQDYSCEIWGLTNRHVLDPGEDTAVAYFGSKNPNLDKCDSIMQPRQGNPSTDEVGKLFELIHIQAHENGYRTSNKVDACLFISRKYPNGSHYLRWDGYISQLGVIPAQPVVATAQMEVSKSGMVTGLTNHVVEGVTEEYTMPWNGKNARFVDQISITMPPYIDEGDSGSLVVAKANKAPVGLLAAVKLVSVEPEKWIALANKIQNVLDASYLFQPRIVGSTATTAQALDADIPQTPCSWMHDGNPRLEEIKKIQERFSAHLHAQLKPVEEFVSLGSRCDDQGEPYFQVGINPNRIEVIEEKGLPDVWEGIPVNYAGMELKKR